MHLHTNAPTPKQEACTGARTLACMQASKQERGGDAEREKGEKGKGEKRTDPGSQKDRRQSEGEREHICMQQDGICVEVALRAEREEQNKNTPTPPARAGRQGEEGDGESAIKGREGEREREREREKNKKTRRKERNKENN